MSRFYDALKEASRSQAQTNDAPAESVPNILDALKASGIDVPPALDPEIHEAASAPEVHPPKANVAPLDLLQAVPLKPNGSTPKLPEEVVTFQVATEPPPRDIPQEEAHYTPEDKRIIDFDPAARLITQAADPAVVEHYR